MDEPYTVGIWTVKPGHEQEFSDTWQEMAQWSLENVSGSTWARLLRDRERANRFVSFGPWERIEDIEAWRASAGFQDRVGHMRELLESFEPGVFELEAEIGV